MKNAFFYETEIGKIGIEEENNFITNIYFEEETGDKNSELNETPLLKKAGEQLQQYFKGERKKFDLPIKTYGTDFQQKVWNALQTIPYGETRSYKDIAIQVGNNKACRAVGMANNKNAISIVIPCHRVVGSNGKLVGYAGGLNVKHFLLKLEKSNA